MMMLGAPGVKWKRGTPLRRMHDRSRGLPGYDVTLQLAQAVMRPLAEVYCRTAPGLLGHCPLLPMFARQFIRHAVIIIVVVVISAE